MATCAGRGCGRYVRKEGEHCSRDCMTGETSKPIAKRETKPVSRLTQLEAVIEHSLTEGTRLYVEAGKALAQIRDGKLYRPEHNTFEEYCQVKWSKSVSRAYRFMQGATIEEILPIGQKPANEAQARELAPVFKSEGSQAVAEVMEKVGPKPTAAKIRKAVQERNQPELEPTYAIEQPCAHPSTTCDNCGEKIQRV